MPNGKAHDGGLRRLIRTDLVHAVGREEVGEDSAQQEQDEHDAASGTQRLLAEQPAEEVRDRPAARSPREGPRLGGDGHQRYLTLGSSRP